MRGIPKFYCMGSWIKPMKDSRHPGGFVLLQRIELLDLTSSLRAIKVISTLLLRQQRHPVTMAFWLGESEQTLKLSSL